MAATPEPRRIGTWQEAEHNAAEWMRAWGYSDARAVPGGPDKGLDIRATRGVAQVKWRSGAVGRPALQQLVGAADAGVELLFFAASNYSKAAVEYAEQHGIALFVFGPWGEMEAVNSTALSVLSRQSTSERDWQWVDDRGSHLARNWAAYVSLGLLVAPFGSLGDDDVYTGPLWLDVLKFCGILFGCWLTAAMFFVVHGNNLEKHTHRRPVPPQSQRGDAEA